MAKDEERAKTISREKERAAKFATRTSRALPDLGPSPGPEQDAAQQDEKAAQAVGDAAGPPAPQPPQLRLPGSALPAITVLLIVVSVAVNLRSLYAGFACMDYEYLIHNPLLRLHTLAPGLLTLPSLAEGGVAVYRPLAMFSYLANYQTWGLNPAGYHASNLTLHMLCSVLVYVLGYQLFGRSLPAVAAALLFAVHPIHAEPVTWLAGRPDLLVTFWALLGAIAFFIYRDPGANPGQHTLARIAYYLFVTLAILSKESAVWLPALFLLWDYLMRRSVRLQWREWLALHLPTLAVAGCLLLARAVLTRGDTVLAAWPLRLASLPGVVVQYLGYLAWPFALTPYHLVRAADAVPAYRNLAYLVLMVGLLAGLWAARRWRPVLTWCGALTLVTLLPTYHFVPRWPSLLSERFLYLPSVGGCLVAGYLGIAAMRRLPRRRYRWGAGLAGLLLLAGLGGLSGGRVNAWADEVTVWQAVVRQHPEMDAARSQLGNAYFNDGHFSQAAESYLQAIRLEPKPNYYYNLGNSLLAMRLSQQAVDTYRQALQLKPHYPECYYNLGNAYLSLADLRQAVAAFRMAVTQGSAGELTEQSLRAIRVLEDYLRKHPAPTSRPEARP